MKDLPAGHPRQQARDGHGRPRAHGPGIAVFERMFRSRVARWEGRPTRAPPPRLVLGRRALDFVRLVRMLAERVLIAKGVRAEQAHVDRVIDGRLAPRTRPPRGHIAVMEALA